MCAKGIEAPISSAVSRNAEDWFFKPVDKQWRVGRPADDSRVSCDGEEVLITSEVNLRTMVTEIRYAKWREKERWKEMRGEKDYYRVGKQ